MDSGPGETEGRANLLASRHVTPKPKIGFCFPEWFETNLPILVLLSAHEEGGLSLGVETFSGPAVLSLSG